MQKSVQKIGLAISSYFLFQSAIPYDLQFAKPAHAQEKLDDKSVNIVKITQTGPSAHRRLKLGLKKAIVLDLPQDAHDILVSDPEMADAITRTSRRIYLFGKSVGQTNLFVFGANGEELVSIDLEIERDTSGLEANLKRFIPDSDINVEIVSDNIVLSGSVRTPQAATQALELAQIFLQGGEATTRSSTATSTGGLGSVAIYAEGRQQSQVINLLQIDGEDQVTLKVTIAEVNRTVLKQLGFNTSISGLPGPITSIGGGSAAVGAGGLSGGLSQNIGPLSITSSFAALETANVARTLAEPTLTAISGQAATFNSGGTRVYANTVFGGYTTYNYGVNLGFKPVVLSSGRISLVIKTNISEPVAAAGGVPEFRNRSTETTVELPSGGTVALAGLISDTINNSATSTPGLSRVPIFGTLFRNKEIRRNESELVIIATPYLIKPVARNQLNRPDDNFSPTSDGKTFFLNRVNKIYGRKEVPVSQFHGSVGFIYK